MAVTENPVTKGLKWLPLRPGTYPIWKIVEVNRTLRITGKHNLWHEHTLVLVFSRATTCQLLCPMLCPFVHRLRAANCHLQDKPKLMFMARIVVYMPLVVSTVSAWSVKDSKLHQTNLQNRTWIPADPKHVWDQGSPGIPQYLKSYRNTYFNVGQTVWYLLLTGNIWKCIEVGNTAILQANGSTTLKSTVPTCCNERTLKCNHAPFTVLLSQPKNTRQKYQ